MKVLSKTFEKVLSNDGYGEPYPNTPSRGVTREGYASHTPTLRKPKFRFMNADAFQMPSAAFALRPLRALWCTAPHIYHSLNIKSRRRPFGFIDVY